MLSIHLLIPSRNLSYWMFITRLLKHIKVDLSDEKTIASSMDINNTVLKRMQTATRVHAPVPPIQPQVLFASGSTSSLVDPYPAIMTQIKVLALNFTTSTEQVLANKSEL